MENLIKICGLSTPESIAAAQSGGATHLGFIFFPKSPRNVMPDRAAELVADLKGIETVAVTVNADDDFLDDIVDTMAPDFLQLHGNESVERVRVVRAEYGLPIIKAIAVREPADLEKALRYDGLVDLLLLDAKAPKGSELPGGNGVSFDWSLIEKFDSKTPVLLSGGIDLDNIGDAMSLVHSDDNYIIGIDVSSGVESAPGVKDITTLSAFLDAAKRPIGTVTK